jgi:hypothetical protein
MRFNVLTKRVLGVVFGLSLLLGIGMTASTTVQAQYRDSQWQREQIRRQREYEREQRRRERQAQRGRRDDRYGRNDDNYSNYGGSYQFRQSALNAGYNEGIKEGRKDRNNGERFDYRDEEDYRNANTGYSSRFGDRQLYAQYFREAFINGYTDGYRGY